MMKFISLFGTLFLVLVIFSLAFASVFLIGYVKNDIQKIINTTDQNIVSEEVNLNENKVEETKIEEEIKKEEKIEGGVFDPKISEWKLVTAEASFAKRDAHNIVVFLDKLWLLGGVGGTAPDYSKNYSDVWNSEDGINWTSITDKAPWGSRRAGEVIVFENKLWLLGGVAAGEKYSNDVWNSEDGINWTLVTDHAGWLARKGFSSVVFNDKMWVIGGVATSGAVNDVWYSENGKDWVLAVEHAEWRERYDLAVETFLGKMWLSGGAFPGDMGEKEVWYTEDGVKWQKTEEKIPWSGRHGHCFNFYNNYLWIIGGWSGYAHGYNDTWYSEDGIIWKQLYEDGNLLWKGREDLECVEFQNKLFLIGGMKTNGGRTNDVWALSGN